MDKDFSCSPAAVKAYMNLSIDESRWLYATLSSTTNQINKEALHNIEVLIMVLYFFLFRQYKKTKSVTSLHAPHKNGSKYLHENYLLISLTSMVCKIGEKKSFLIGQLS